MKRIVPLFVVFVLGILPMFSQVIHVPADSSTIQAAINGASDGDTVLVSEGLYYENINFLGKSITVASQFIMDGDTSHISKTIIDGSQPANPDTASVVLMCSGEDTTSVLCGFTVTGGSGTIIYLPEVEIEIRVGGGIAMNKACGMILNNIVKENSINPSENIGQSGGGIYASRSGISYGIISNNTIIGNEITRGYSMGAGLALDGGPFLVDNNEIISNVIHWGNGGAGVAWNNSYETSSKPSYFRENLVTHNNAASTSGGYGIGGGMLFQWMAENDTVIIQNNIFAYNKCRYAVGGLYIFCKDGTFIVENNTIYQNTSDNIYNSFGFIRSGSEPLILLNNIIWSDKEGIDICLDDVTLYVYSNILGNLNSENLAKLKCNIFIDPKISEEDYHPLPGSPAIGRGLDSIQIEDTWYFTPKTDFLGNARPHPIDEYMDIGAIESGYGIDLIPPILTLSTNSFHVVNDTELIAKSSENGKIHLVPENTPKDLTEISKVCSNPNECMANTEVILSVSKEIDSVYWVYASDFSGNISEHVEVVVYGVGIENQKTASFKLYPNPTNNLLTIETEHTDLHIIEIIALSGQRIYSTEMDGSTRQIDMSSYSKGIYFVTIRSKAFVRTEKIIKF